MANPNTSAQHTLGDTNVQTGITATVIVVAIIVNAAVILRLITRKYVVKSLGWDDWTILVATIANNVGIALVLVEVHWGFGRHRDTLTPESYAEFLRYTYAEWIQTFQTLMLTKISICLLLLRIVISRAFVYSLWSLIAALIISNIILTVLWMVQCRPLWFAWEQPMQTGACFNQSELLNIILAQALVSVTSDFILAAYPIFILRKLKMPMKTKLGVCILMGLGVITGSLCIVRTTLNWENVNNDVTWNGVQNWYWRNWEVCIGIVIACVPALRPGYLSLRGRGDEYRVTQSGSRVSGIRGPSSSMNVSQHSKPSNAPSVPLHSASAPPSIPKKPLPSIPILPPNTLRPDLRAARATVGTEISHDSLYLPIQTTSGDGIVKMTRVDLESQRATSGEDSEEAEEARRAPGWDNSQTTLRDNVGGIV